MNYTSKIAAWLEKHPVVGLPVHVISFLYHYITSFKWVIDIVRWMVTTAGNIAESAFLLATVYVTTNTVAHLLVTWILPAQMIVTLNQISTMAFSVLPELIIAQALKITFDHWKVVWRSPKRVDAWIWACSYTIPTLVFLIMTVATISTFVNFEAANTTPPQATGLMLVTRCLAGWSYGMVQILFVSIGKQGYVDMLDDLHAQIHTRDEALAESKEMLSTLQQDIATLQEQMAQQESALFDAQMALATRRMTRSPMPTTKSPIGIMPIRPTRKSDAKSGLKTTQPLDTVAQSSGLTTPQGQESTVYNSGLTTPQSLDSTVYSTVHETRQESSQLLDSSTHKSGPDSGLSVDTIVHKNTPESGLDNEQSLDSNVHKTTQSNGIGSEQGVDSIVLSTVHKTERRSLQSSNKTVSSTTHKNSEAAKKIQRILRKNPNTGPTELAAKTGVSRSYASLVKSQFLTQLAAEQSA